jgi:hypothetical protein
MKVIMCEQGTVDWWEAKRGIPSASNFDRILTMAAAAPGWICVGPIGETCGTRHKKEEAAIECCRKANKKGANLSPVPSKPELCGAHLDYICELIADVCRLTPPTDLGAYTSRAMQNGIDTEPEARNWYSLESNQDVQQVGVCITDDGRFAASPDGLVGEDGGLELKCPDLKTQVRYLIDGGLPAEYVPQVHGNLIVSGRAWWDFLSYAPGLPPLRVRVTPNEYTEALRTALDEFWDRYRLLLRDFRAEPLVVGGTQ